MQSFMTMSARWLACAGLATSVGGCGQLLAYPEVELENTASTCGDGKDNDLDGRTDCEDPDCGPYCIEGTQATCSDGVDNDQNQKPDCQDPKCAAFCPEADALACSDGQDNDSDGKTDCDDPGCDGFCPEESAAACNDGRDNDGDGLVDAADARCWLLSAPKVERCAQTSGVEIIENFDTGTAVAEWNAHGLLQAAFRDSEAAGARRDGLVLLATDTTGSSTPGVTLGTLIRRWPFAGSWRGFELSFSASVPQGTLLRAGIVPVALAPVTDPPLPGAEAALFSLTLDATGSDLALTLDVEGVSLSKTLPRTLVACDGLSCTESLSRVRVVLDDQGFRATLTSPNGESAELLAPGGPSSLSLSPSRLAFWGGSTATSAPSVALDDVRLSVAAERPCGLVTPQIPGQACGFIDQLDAFGHVVSLAKGSAGEHCALVTASHDASVPNPETLTAWQSPDGRIWTPASALDAPPVELPEQTTLVGAGIAHDDQGWHVAVAYREQQDVRLGFASSATCGAWGKLAPGPSLFPDAEPPSYVIADGRHDIYFTRPPNDSTHRTLWRTQRVAPGAVQPKPELLAELPTNVGNPVSVEQVGTRDLVLVHPAAPSSGASGIGLLVGDPAGRVWKSLDPSPLLRMASLENDGETPVSFDDRGVTSAVLSWGQNGGFLLYGGRSSLGSSGSTGYQPLLAVGSARMLPADQTFPEAPRNESTCGDATCAADESCESCAADCSCPGPLLLSDVFTQQRPWKIVSSDLNPGRVQYLDLERGALNWAGGGNTWSVLPLEHAIVGDFELSFDLMLSRLDWLGNVSAPTLPSCSVYIGLGTVPDPTAAVGSATAAAQAGVFARISGEPLCTGTAFSKPAVLSADKVFEDPPVFPGGEGASASQEDESPGVGPCPSPSLWTVETRRHMVLRREGGKVSLGVGRENGCMLERTVSYDRPLPELPALLVGFGGGDLFGCDAGFGSGTTTNVRLRLLDDPNHCPATKEPCGAGAEEPTCVDTSSSIEHCGACGHACGVNQVCEHAICVCKNDPGILACAGTCIDSSTSMHDCGACGNACVESCSAGVCDIAGDCDTPVPLDPQSSGVRIDFSQLRDSDMTVCDGGFRSLVLSYTASVSGVATFELDPRGTGLDTVLGVTEDRLCESWQPCNDDAGDLGLGSRVSLPVVAGTTYRIGVALEDNLFLLGTVELRIEVTP